MEAMSKPPVTIHDAFFKQVIGDPVMADRFLREHLPPAVVSLLGPDLPELVPGSFVDEDLGQHHTDLLFKVRLITGDEALIHLVVEHKSAPDPLARLQLLRYVVRVLVDWHRKNHRLPLPPVVPLLAHHGPEGWEISTQFADLFGSQPDALRPFLPSFRHALVDLIGIDDQALSQHIRLRAFLKVLKYILRPDLPECIDVVLAEAPDLDVVDVVLILTYIGRGPVAVGEEVVRAALRRLVPAREEEIMASFGQRYFEEGKATGIAQGEAKGEAKALIRLVERRFGPLPADLRARVLAADAATIETWLDHLMEAPNLGVLFGTTN